MMPISVTTLFLTIYGLTWFSFIIGVLLTKSRNKSTLKMRRLFVNRQIQKFRYQPFKTLLKFWTAKKYFIATLTFIIILPAVFMYFSLGLILITPILAVIQGLIVGFFSGRLKGKISPG